MDKKVDKGVERWEDWTWNPVLELEVEEAMEFMETKARLVEMSRAVGSSTIPFSEIVRTPLYTQGERLVRDDVHAELRPPNDLEGYTIGVDVARNTPNPPSNAERGERISTIILDEWANYPNNTLNNGGI